MNKGCELSRRDPRHQIPQYRAHPFGIGLLQNIQLQNGVGHVGTHFRHLLLTQDVPPGHLDEAAAGHQAGQTGVDEAFAGEAVQHHMNTFTPCDFQDLGSESGLATVEDVLDADRSQVCLLRRTGGGKHFGTGGVGQLYGRQSHAARAGMNQYPFPGLEPGVLERQRGRYERAGDGRQGRCGDPRRRRRHQLPVGHHFRCEGAKAQSHHTVADGDG